jgi:YqjK-like protein
MSQPVQSRAQRRAELVRRIAAERELVGAAWLLARQQLAVAQDGLQLLRAVSRNPVLIAAAAVTAWMIGPQRSLSLLKNIMFGWSTWRRIAGQ